jgi:enoyl-CoA hydratase/carnithine racemase
VEDDILLRDDDGAVATLTLNNPGKLNALSEAMLQALEAELGLLAGESEIRAVILKGAGRAFCAGHDLKEMTAARQAEDGGLARFRALFERCSRVMLAITRLPQPVIAEVHGIATAAWRPRGRGSGSTASTSGSSARRRWWR